jgi:hypothetical protein
MCTDGGYRHWMRFSADSRAWTAACERVHTGRAMSQEQVEIVKRANAALNAGDIETVLDAYASGATFRDLAQLAGQRRPRYAPAHG